MAMPRVTAAEVIHAVVVLAAKTKAFIPAEPNTVPRIAGASRGDLLAQLLAHGGANCEVSSQARRIALTRRMLTHNRAEPKRAHR
jgi:hypothetical protein